MRSVSTNRRLGVVVLLVVILLGPGASAAEAPTAGDSGLWASFVAWLEGRLTLPPGIAADDAGFTAWLMSRLEIPNG